MTSQSATPTDRSDAAANQIPPAELSGEELRAAVRDRYAGAARRASEKLALAQPVSGPAMSCCGPTCCSGDEGNAMDAPDPISRDLYDAATGAEFSAALAASLGCGNPTALADLKPGQVVLDLGSGGGLDVLLSAKRVGPTGKAYGLDMTDEMLELARRNQREAEITNAEFLKGTIENVPLPEASVDVIISNCVINLAADKDAVLREAFRVLRPGGQFAVSDIVLLRPIPPLAQRAMTLWTGCIGGALLDSDYMAKLSAAGFDSAEVTVTREYSRQDMADLAATLDPAEIPAGVSIDEVVDLMDGAVASAFIRAVKA